MCTQYYFSEAVLSRKATRKRILVMMAILLWPATFASIDSYEVGGRLSEHIHAPEAVKLSPIQIPKGLDLPDVLGIPHELTSKILLNDVDRKDVDTIEIFLTTRRLEAG
jgi:hypothetical protein